MVAAGPFPLLSAVPGGCDRAGPLEDARRRGRRPATAAEWAWGGGGSRTVAEALTAAMLWRGPCWGFILRIQVLPTLQQLYDFGGGVMVARPSVSRRSVSAAPWCRGRDALPGISGGTKVVRLVILGFLEAVTGW